MFHENIDISISEGVGSPAIAKKGSLGIIYLHDKMPCSMVDIRFSVKFMIY